MSVIMPAVLLFLFTFILVPKAHAIVFLPALLLIPIAKIVALVIGGFSIPALGLGALWGKFTHMPVKKILLVIFFFLLVLALAFAIVLKIENPSRPLF